MTAVIVPDHAATVLLLRPALSGFEVLMVERNARGFFGGIVVFPGGSVDEIDRRAGDSDEKSARRAAIRELAEEAGIVLTRNDALAAPRLKDEAFYRWLDDNSIETGADSLMLVSRWVTPELAPRRFDTRFYLASSDVMPDVRIDADELIGHSWVSPQRALERYDAGEWSMILPTLAHVRWLSRRSSIEDAFESARGADGRTLVEPRQIEDGSLLPVLLPESTP